MQERVNRFDHALNFFSLSAHRNAIYGFAALWVVAFHGLDMKLATLPHKLDLFADLMRLGNMGVDIFLLLSGIGLYYSFSKDSRLLRFYYKRLIRIVVPYLLLATPYMVYMYFIASYKPATFFMSLSTAAYWVGYKQQMSLWYVPSILALYLVYPLIHRFIYMHRERRLLRTLILIGLSVVLTVVVLHFIPKNMEEFYDRFLPRIAVFILGCYFGSFVKEKRPMPVWLLFAAMIVVLGAFPLYARRILPWVFYRYYGSMTGVMATILLAQFFVLFRSMRLDRFFAFFGAFSLELYIAHIALRNFYMHSPYYGGHIWKEYAVIAAASILIAFLASLIEKPVFKLLNRPLRE